MFETTWGQLVRKTRRRPLIWMPVVVRSEDGLVIRRSVGQRIFLILVALLLGVVFTGFGLSTAIPLFGRVILLIIGPLCLFVVLRTLLFTASVSWRTGSGRLDVRYGFVLLPRWLTLDRRPLGAVLQLAHQTSLIKASRWGRMSYRRYPVISLRDPSTGEEAHIGYLGKTASVFEALKEILGGESLDRTVAEIPLQDGRTLSVKKTATWEGGHPSSYSYRSELSVPEPGMVEIERKPLGRRYRRAFPPEYPVHIERTQEALQIRYSDDEEKTIPSSRCVGIQICRAEGAGNRHELNLILDDEDRDRLNLVSLDPVPHANLYPADPRALGRQLADALRLPVYDHMI